MKPFRLLSLILVSLNTTSMCAQTLRVASANTWSGLDYRGTIKMGEFESVETREKRMRILLEELKRRQPDVIALQEVNPVARTSARLAEELDYDCIYQRTNSGLKLGSFGLPWNLDEGLAILAKKELRLQMVDVLDLSETCGVFGNVVSLHTRDQNIALVGRIIVDGVHFFVLNIHLVNVVPVTGQSDSVLTEILKTKGSDDGDIAGVVRRFREENEIPAHELKVLQQHLLSSLSGAHAIIMGDFNLASTSADIRSFVRETRLTDVMGGSPSEDHPTWDAGHNTNTRFSIELAHLQTREADPLDLLGAWYDKQSRRIDYIFLNERFRSGDVKRSGIFLDTPAGELFASDHYGVFADLDVTTAINDGPKSSESLQTTMESTFEPFPIVSYDTDVGLGYGAKAFYLNPLGKSESFDLILFNSTKGERWYRFVFSLPDLELRQGRTYPLAIDLVVDYDKYLKNSFFGVGNSSRRDDREYYTREPFELSIAASSGFTPRSVGQLGFRYKSVRNFGFSDRSRLRFLPQGLNSETARFHSVFASYRFDSRNSFINPSRGWVLQGEVEYAPMSGAVSVELARWAAWIQYYSVIFYPKTVIALRAGIQSLMGDDLPIQVLLPVGGTQTLRGFPQDRFLDKTSAVFNAEVRFPIYWRFGGVLGYDAGKVWSSPNKMDLAQWAVNPVLGLRFFMETFFVRADLGFGSETTGFYLNFGHLF